MKAKNIFTLVTAALLLASCLQDNSSTISRGMQIVASDKNISRTDFNGSKTSWQANDAMTVIVEGTGFSVPTPYKFVTTDPTNGLFTNSQITTDEQTTYNFYAIYPDTPEKTSIDNSDGKTYNIGAAEQTQQASSASHIAALDPLIGSVSDIPSKATIEMNHTATVIAVKLTNNTSSAIEGIKELKITAPTDVAIAGKHTINLKNLTCTIDNNSNNSKRNIINVTVNNSGSIAAGESFTVWAAATPFTIAAADRITIDITDNTDRKFSIIKTFKSEKSFLAGKIMSTTMSLDNNTLNKIVSLDLATSTSYPDAFPKASGTTSGTYTLGGYSISFTAPTAFYYTTGVGLKITGLTTKNNATISIPKISGYAPVKVEITAASDYRNSNTKFSITDNANNVVTNTSGNDSRYPSAAPMIFTNNSTDDQTQYYINIVGTNTSSKSSCLEQISITYVKL